MSDTVHIPPNPAWRCDKCGYESDLSPYKLIDASRKVVVETTFCMACLFRWIETQGLGQMQEARREKS